MDQYEDIATAQIIDACMRLKIPYRIAAAGIKPVAAVSGMVHGPAIPVRHYGSVDVFLEVFETFKTTGILVIDNGGRTDEACIGDLVVLEAELAGVSAIVVWGLHRDTRDLTEIKLPVFSYGAFPSGPSRLEVWEPDVFQTARFGDFTVSRNDSVFADHDGVVFVETVQLDRILPVALSIREKELKQASTAREGVSLREQFAFAAYLKMRSEQTDYTFRKHLTAISKAVEE
jgi:4-hydroxy-4-methyl-2-oxoglutarate aldolase